MKTYLQSFLLAIIIVGIGVNSSKYFKPVKTNTGNENRDKGERHDNLYKKPDGSYYTAEELLAISKKVNEMPTDRGQRSVNSWSLVGPDYIKTSKTNISYTGRVRSLELVNPVDANDNGLRVGSASGGVWKMHPFLVAAYGESMQGNMPTLNIGSTATNPLNSNIMIAGTGEPYQSYGMGLFKTFDLGQHWNPVQWDATAIPVWVWKVLYHPTDTNLVWAATSSGLYRSFDGGNTWHNQFLYVSGETSDLILDVQHPDTMYVAVAYDRIWRTYNAGSTWWPLSNGPVGFGIANMALAPSSPNIIYAVCDSFNSHTKGIYKSVDYGNNWQTCPYTNDTGATGFNFHWNGGHYNQCISVKPTDPNLVLVGGGSMMRSKDGFNFLEGSAWESDGHHDNHTMVWRPDGSAVYLGNDGGLFVSTDDGVSFNASLNILPITQFYDFDVNMFNPNYIIGAAQDNAIPCYNGIDWKYGGAGDGWSVAFNYANGTDAISRWNTALDYSTNDGQTWNNIGAPYGDQGYSIVRYEKSINMVWPYINAPLLNDTDNIFYRDLVGNWAQLNPNSQFPTPIGHFSVSNRLNSGDRNNIYLSMVNNPSKVWKRDRGTGNFVDITHGLPTDSGAFFRTYAAPRNFDLVFAVQDGTKNIYKSADAGATNWAQISTADIPTGVAINCLFVNPYNTNEIYVGTNGFGVFKTVTNGGQWARWENGMPLGMNVTSLHMVDSFSTNGKIILYASSYGRGIWKREMSGNDPTAVREVANAENYRLNNFPLSSGTGEIPVSYFCPVNSNITFQIFDLTGKLVAVIRTKNLDAGEHVDRLDVSGFSSGTYICTMLANGVNVGNRKFVIAGY